MNGWPRLSVLLPNFNHARYLRESLPALLAHPEIPAEIIVVDDASTDESLRVLDEIAASDPRVTVHRNARNVGVVGNLDRLLGMAKGEYVYSAAADDFVLPGFFERALGLLAEHPQAGLCSTLTWMIDGDGKRLGVLPTPMVTAEAVYLSPAQVRAVLRSVGAWFQGNTVIHRREALTDAGGYRSELESFADAFAAHVSALRNGACFIPEPLTAWRMLPGTYSRGVFRDQTRRRAMTARAVELMEGAFKDDFPVGYADQWRREMEWSASRETAAELRTRHAGFGRILGWIEWSARMAALVPSMPRHVLRRSVIRFTSGRRLSRR